MLLLDVATVLLALLAVRQVLSISAWLWNLYATIKNNRVLKQAADSAVNATAEEKARLAELRAKGMHLR